MPTESTLDIALPTCPYELSETLVALVAETVEGRGCAVLFVDDEADQLASLKALFRGGYEVLTATSAAEAEAILAARYAANLPVCAIISDQRMPGGTGAELLAKARRVSPVTIRILMTAYSDISAVIDAINRGQINHYVSKPVDPAAFAKILREATAVSVLMQRFSNASGTRRKSD